ncbi:FAD-binding oxidoreductase [Luteolibacter pohnpeiensis]|uniref:FAD-binding oxidoreductase n=1 Tax=Luteolibacter pohnpeiensis TaxID=454153 RepID=A0A934S6Y3_9BACT|nr:FAD-dependent oxidoreductase [Luteolibacter pohnpeiensis]MBK1882405.1 FAD-binding oxidoreductase [Luteolibacter pohnpeiensis]
MIGESASWTIVGQGLAGTCLAWHFWQRGIEFKLLDHGTGGASRVAAGLLNPVTGKNFEPSWRIDEFLPEAVEFYRAIEQKLGRKLWYPMPVLRLASADKEWRKIEGKLGEDRVSPWVDSVVEAPEGFVGAVQVKGGGRFDTRTFVEASRNFFAGHDLFTDATRRCVVWCEGAAGLIQGKYGAHRCAKGEILTVRANHWDGSRIKVGGGGWLVPVGPGLFKSGATYEWDDLDETPTAKGREFVERILHRLGGTDYEIIAHDAGIRPILRRSEPLIGPVGENEWMFNGLGSKGSLYAPGVARRLASWLIDGIEPDTELDFRFHVAK